MKVKLLKDKQILLLPKLILLKNTTYEVIDVIVDCYRIKIPMKQKGKFRYALLKEDEGELV